MGAPGKKAPCDGTGRRMGAPGKKEKKMNESGSEASHEAPHLAAPSRTQQLLPGCSSRLNFFLFGDGC
jgi:hypothetical protein